MTKINIILLFFFLWHTCFAKIVTENGEVTNDGSETDVLVLVDQARDWAQHLGMHDRSKNHPQKSDVAELPPFALLPTAIPRKMYEQAYAVQEPMAELYFKVASDYKFLADCFRDVRKVDQTMSKLMDLLDELHQEEMRQPITLLVSRSDYMFHTCEDCDESQRHQLKQIEMNVGPVGGSLSQKTTLLHQRIFRKAGIDPKFLPDNKPNDTLAEGLYEAWKSFGDPNAIFLSVLSKRNISHYEMRDIEYRLEELSDDKIRIIHLSPVEAYEQLRLADDFKLMLGDNVVAVVHFKHARVLDPKFLHPKQISLWRMVERSTAIKCPTIGMDLASSKKVQQVLAQDGVLEQLFPDSKDAHKVAAIRQIQAGLWPLDHIDAKTEALIKDAISHPEDYVLKPNREAGGNNFWDEALKHLLERMEPDQLGAFVLMQRLRPLVTKNFLVKPMEDGARFEEVVTELGVFGALLGSQQTGQVLYNRVGGHLMRTKPKDVKEGGVDHGAGFFDSPILY